MGIGIVAVAMFLPCCCPQRQRAWAVNCLNAANERETVEGFLERADCRHLYALLFFFFFWISRRNPFVRVVWSGGESRCDGLGNDVDDRSAVRRIILGWRFVDSML